MSGHTKGPWSSPIYHGTEEMIIEARAVGLEPVPALTNDGSRFVMGRDADGESKRVALVDCQTGYKRGKGHQTECAERDANARLIAAAPELLEGLKLAVVSLRTHVAPADVGAELFDLSDSKELRPIFAALRSARGEA